MPRKHKTRRNPRKRKGGKFMGFGAFGCSYNPSVRCITDSKTFPSSDEMITKFMSQKEAVKEIDAGLLIEDAFKELNLTVDPYSIILYPKQICKIPTNISANELAENPLHSCPVPITDPVLVQMPNGGIDLFKFLCPPQDVRAYLNSILELVDGLATLHSADIAHMDIKVENIVTRKVGDVYQTRFIDVGFIQDLTKYSTKNPFVKFANNYIVWPFETKFLVKKFTEIHFGIHKPVILQSIRDFSQMVLTLFPSQHLPLALYFRNNAFLLMNESQDGYSEVFSRNMQHLTGIFNQKKEYKDVTEYIAKITDVYSFGIVLYNIYIRVTGQALTQTLDIVNIKPISNPTDLALFYDLKNNVSKDMFNIVFEMMNPFIEQRLRDLAVIKPRLAELFGRISTIFEKYYPK